MLSFLYSFSLKLFSWAKGQTQELFLGLGFILRKKAVFFVALLALFCEQSAFARPSSSSAYLLAGSDEAMLARSAALAAAEEQQKKRKSAVFAANPRLLQNLSRYLVEDEEKSYLSFKEACEKDKKAAEECCASPKLCAGLAMDLAKGITPLLPGLFSTYRGYQISKDASDSKITRQQAAAKMCSAQNVMQLGGFSSQLMLQLTPMVESSCKDNISQCRLSCDKKIEMFKADLKSAFSSLESGEEKRSLGEDIDSLLGWAEKCAEGRFDEDINLEADVTNLGEGKLLIGQNTTGESICEEYDDQHITSTAFLIKTQTIGYIFLFASAYKNSSIDKKEKLSQKSNEKEIIDCASQPHRAISPRNSPGYVRPPMIQVCQKAVETALENPEPPPFTPANPGASPPGLFTGNTNTPKGNPLLSMDNPGEGVVPDPDDELPDPNNRPPLVSPGNLPGFRSSSPSGGYSPGGSLGGPGGVGGWPGPEGDADPGFSYAPGAPDGLSSDSFAGGEAGLFAGGSPAGGYSPGAGGGGYREPGSEGKGFDSGGAPFGDDEGFDSDSGDSIFQVASRRIKQFCSDHSCMK